MTEPNPTPDRSTPDDAPKPDVGRNRSPAEGGLTGAEQAKAVAATAAGAGCLATGFLPILFVGLGAVGLLLTLGLFRSGCQADDGTGTPEVPVRVESP